MKNYLKYLILAIAALAFGEASDMSDKTFHDECLSYKIEYSQSSTFISEPNTDLCIPRNVSGATPARLKSGSRRSESSPRNNFDYIKSARSANIFIGYIMQKSVSASLSSFLDSIDKLLLQGKLLI